MEEYNKKEETGPERKKVKGGERVKRIVESFTFNLVSALGWAFLGWAYYGLYSYHAWGRWLWVIPLILFANFSVRTIKAARRHLNKKQDAKT